MLSSPLAGTWTVALHNPAAWLFTAILVIVFPIADYLLYHRLKSTLGIYVWNIAAEWTLVAGCLWMLRINGLRLADLGERLGNPVRTIAAIAVVCVIVALLTIISKMQRRKLNPEQLSKATAGLRRLLPLTATERMTWIAVSVTAGICEEFLYRGWLLGLIAAAVGSVWISLIVTSIIFGFAHIYQGRNGLIGASLGGVVFGLVYVLSGSLLPGQLIHTFIDLNNGLSLGQTVARAQASQSA
jgi:uncharacterized protein